MSSVSFHSPAGVESHVMPPPVPKWIWPSANQNVPRGADVYLMARVMQNWADRDAALILRNVREAMASSSRLLIVGHLPERERPSEFLEAMSLSMFVLYGAPLRSRQDYEGLFAPAGLSLHQVHRVPDGESIMDVRPVPTP